MSVKPAIPVQMKLSEKLSSLINQAKQKETPQNNDETSKKILVSQQETVKQDRKEIRNSVYMSSINVDNSSTEETKNVKKQSVKGKSEKKKRSFAIKEVTRTESENVYMPQNISDESQSIETNDVELPPLEARKSPKKLRRERKGEGKGVARDGITDTTDIPPQIEGLVINGESIGKLLEDDGGLSEMNASAKKYASEAIDVMADIMRDRFARPADRLNAANMILEKAYGKTPAKGGHGESRVPSVIVLPAFNISVGTGTRANHDEPRRIGKGESITIDTESITGIQCDSDTDEPIN